MTYQRIDANHQEMKTFQKNTIEALESINQSLKRLVHLQEEIEELEKDKVIKDATIKRMEQRLIKLEAKDVRIINEHIKNIYKEGELHENRTIRNFRIDTNVFYAAMRSKKGASYKLLSLIDSGKFRVNVSVPLNCEFEDVAKRSPDVLTVSETERDDILDHI